MSHEGYLKVILVSKVWQGFPKKEQNVQRQGDKVS